MVYTYLLMLLAHVGAKTDSTTGVATVRDMANLHCSRYVDMHKDVQYGVQYVLKVLHFSAFTMP